MAIYMAWHGMAYTFRERNKQPIGVFRIHSMLRGRHHRREHRRRQHHRRRLRRHHRHSIAIAIRIIF